MKRTVAEWINFLNQGNEHYIGVKSEENKNTLPITHYVKADECLEKFDGWLDEIVVKPYICNLKKDNKFYHLLII